MVTGGSSLLAADDAVLYGGPHERLWDLATAFSSVFCVWNLFKALSGLMWKYVDLTLDVICIWTFSLGAWTPQ